jgi:uncharacterized membrane protein
MIVVFPIHLVAIIVWLGGLFALMVVLSPATRAMDSVAHASLWHRALSRFFVWGSISLGIIVATGIALVHLRFAGQPPLIHRVNMFIGVPAIALFVYVLLGPYRSCRRAIADRDWKAAEHSVSRIRVLLALVLLLGMVSSVVSAVGRYL